MHAGFCGGGGCLENRRAGVGLCVGGGGGAVVRVGVCVRGWVGWQSTTGSAVCHGTAPCPNMFHPKAVLTWRRGLVCAAGGGSVLPGEDFVAGWRPVGRLVGLAGAGARRLSWGTLGPPCFPGDPCAVACGAESWGGRCRGGDRQARTGTMRGSHCVGRCRCLCGVRGGLRLAAYLSPWLASGVGGGGGARALRGRSPRWTCPAGRPGWSPRRRPGGAGGAAVRLGRPAQRPGRKGWRGGQLRHAGGSWPGGQGWPTPGLRGRTRRARGRGPRPDGREGGD